MHQGTFSTSLRCQLVFLWVFLQIIPLAAAAAQTPTHWSVSGGIAKAEKELEPGNYVHVTAKDNMRDAKEVLADVAVLGLRGRIRQETVNGKTLLLVLSGPFTSRESAEKARDKIMNYGYGDKTQEIKLVGTLMPTPTKTPHLDEYGEPYR